MEQVVASVDPEAVIREAREIFLLLREQDNRGNASGGNSGDKWHQGDLLQGQWKASLNQGNAGSDSATSPDNHQNRHRRLPPRPPRPRQPMQRLLTKYM